MTTPELVQLGTTLVNNAQAQGITLRMIGGVAIYARCPGIATNPRLQRENVDLAFIAAQDAWNRIGDFFRAHGFTPETTLANPMHLMQGKLAISVSSPNFREDFPLDFSARLTVTPLTLPLADLLLIKLARLHFQEHDIQDSAALLVDHRVTTGGDEEEEINREHLYQVANQDYRLWKTIFDNTVALEKIFDKYLDPGEAQLAWRRIELLQEVLDGKAHSPGWWAGRVLAR